MLLFNLAFVMSCCHGPKHLQCAGVERLQRPHSQAAQGHQPP